MTNLYTIQVKFENSNNTYDYGTDVPGTEVGDKALVIGDFNSVKTVRVVGVLSGLSKKTTKAVAGIIKSNKPVNELNVTLTQLHAEEKRREKERADYLNKAFAEFLKKKDPTFAAFDIESPFIE